MINYTQVTHVYRTQNEVNINFRLTTSFLALSLVTLHPHLYLINSFLMKWETVASGIGYSVYTLWNNGRKLVTLVFNSNSKAARVECADEKRVFLVRKEGFLKNKTVLSNEYGVRICKTGFENNREFIELDQQRYYFSVDTDKQPSITIYQKSKEEPLAVCAINADDKDLKIDLSGKTKALKEDTKYSLLMTMCWYLFGNPMNIAQEKKLEYSF